MTSNDAASLDRDKIKNVIRAYLKLYRYLHEWRIQKLLFYADVHSLNSRGTRLTRAPFKRYTYGVYSRAIATALSEMSDLKRSPDVAPDGRETVKYSLPEGDKVSGISDEEWRIITEAHEATRAMTTQDIADWGKQTDLWRNSSFGDLLDFDRYAKEIVRDRPERVKKLMGTRARSLSSKARYSTPEEMLSELEFGTKPSSRAQKGR